ncbi:MAG: hypothetical protein NTV04_20530 [Deltaproteobacteria bacterium]|nr:hypothetical protein [Deltaproteobacteria bacterium]
MTIQPWARILPGSMLCLLVTLLPILRSAMRSRHDLVVENLALGHRLVTLAARRHPGIRPADRVFWILLRRFWSGWGESLTIVRPDTVVRWHRASFRICWNWPSRRGTRSGRPPLRFRNCGYPTRKAVCFSYSLLAAVAETGWLPWSRMI